jgi:formamidopyrimidine-DNA glycosylase
MSGRWQKSYDEYCKWFVELEDGYTIWFRDTRSFATVKFTRNEQILQDKLNKLGPDIMSREFKLPEFKKICERYPKRNICAFLMDQEIISGCGNYIKAEVLYYSKVSPLRKVESLSNKDIEQIYQGLYIISRISYNNKGLSLRDYTDHNGKEGCHNRELKIYGKKLATRTKTPDGRSTYWEPKIQV